MPDIKVSSSLILIPYYDKVIHLIMFGFFAAVMVFDYFRRYKYINRFQMFICGIISMLIGGVIEIIQEKMNMGRAGEWMDFIADCSGALIFAFISGYFCNRWIEIKN